MTSVTPSPLGGAVRSGLIAGAVAFVIRLAFALTLERMAVGPALGVSLAFLVGTALLVALGIVVVTWLVGRRA